MTPRRTKGSLLTHRSLSYAWLGVLVVCGLLLPPCLEAQQVVRVGPASGGLGSAVTVTVEDTRDSFGSVDSDDWLPFLGDTPVLGSDVVWASTRLRIDTTRVDSAGVGSAGGGSIHVDTTWVETIRFVLRRDADSEESRAAWRQLLREEGGFTEARYELSVGTDETGPFESDVTFTLEKLRPWRTGFAGLLLVALIFGFFWLAKDTAIIRVGNKESAFSLGRSQMAWWTFLVIGSLLALWLAVGDLSVSPSALVLLGISGTTGLAAVSVRRDLGKRGSGNFVKDILSDQNERVTLHRFQMMSWSLVLGAIYVVEVLVNHNVPVFDSTLLTLMGISSGTYVGFKFPEPDNPPLAIKSPSSPAALKGAKDQALMIELETGPEGMAIEGVNTTGAADNGQLTQRSHKEWTYVRGSKAADTVTLEFSLAADPKEKVELVIEKV